MQTILLGALLISALTLGAVFIMPSLSEKELVRVSLGETEVVVEVARDPLSRTRGLSGRDGLPGKSGMLFVFERSDRWGIWMKDMRFPIDIFWIKDGKVMDLEEKVAPPAPGTPDLRLAIYRPDVPADVVLEVNAGFAEKFDIKTGDPVRILSEDPIFRRSSGTAASERSGAPQSASAPQEPGREYYIETLRKNPVSGDDFFIKKILEVNSRYNKFLVSYKSGKFNLTGVMNIPNNIPPSGGYPVIILNHGLIFPDVYYSGRGSRREQDFFARNGYVTIHPDYRYHAKSPEEALAEDKDKDPAPRGRAHHDFYAGYTEDVMALIDALKKREPRLLDLSRIGMWGHSMGGGIASRVMVLRPEVRAYVLFAPLSADVEDNFYELSDSEKDWLAKTYGLGGAAAEIYKKISPLTYFSKISAPVQLHHGTADKDVPIEFSEKMFGALQGYGKKVEFFKYTGEGHEFGEAWQVAAERALQFFDRYVKGAR